MTRRRFRRVRSAAVELGLAATHWLVCAWRGHTPVGGEWCSTCGADPAHFGPGRWP